MVKKCGRKPKPYVIYQGEVIVGLSFDANERQRRHYYYYTDDKGRRRKKTLCSDVGEAVKLYKQSDEWRRRSQEVFEEARGRPVPSGDRLNLEQVIDLYINRQEYKKGKARLSDRARYNEERWWNEFLSLTGLKANTKVTELRDRHFLEYRKNVQCIKARKSGRSSNEAIRAREYVGGIIGIRSINNRMIAVKRILNHAAEMTQSLSVRDIYNCSKKYLKLFPEDKQSGQAWIDEKLFHKMLRHCDERMKAVLLLALNCGFGISDICKLELSEIKISDRMYVKNTSGTKPPRVAVLWDRTVQAIEKYLDLRKQGCEQLREKESKELTGGKKLRMGDEKYERLLNKWGKQKVHEKRYFLLSERGAMYSRDGLNRLWTELRKQSGMGKQIQFGHIMKSCRKVAESTNCSVQQIRLFFGLLAIRMLGKSNKELRDQVENICTSVEEKYFPQRSIPKGAERSSIQKKAD